MIIQSQAAYQFTPNTPAPNSAPAAQETYKDSPEHGISIYAQNVKRIYADLVPATDLKEFSQIKAQPLIKERLETGSPQDVQNYRARMLEQGNHRDTDAIFRVDGNIIASLNESGAGEMSNSVAHALRNVTSNLASIEQALEDKYGTRLQVEKFALGEGPTQAQLFEMRHGRSLNSHINETTGQMKAAFNARQYQIQQDKAEQQKRDSVEQSTAFTINNRVVGSLGIDGTININHAILSVEMDNAGVNKEIGRQLLALGATTKNAGEVSEVLRKGFAENTLQVDQFPLEKGPSLGELARMMSEQQATQVRFSA